MSYEKISSALSKNKICAVSKLQPPIKIRELYAKGQRIFGENYVQEALEKQDILKDLPGIEWHLIGHLQKNKAKQVVGKFSLIHSVDSLDLAKTLGRLASARQLTQKVLIQVNLAEEESKSGFNKAEFEKAWPELQQIPGLNICGLMTMPPLTENPEDVRPYFRELAQLLRQRPGLTVLSMGTSHDYQVALEEGATIVRLGTILFGERPVNR
jgi:pyridoxal phosphate enzyme (YggS family)